MQVNVGRAPAWAPPPRESKGVKSVLGVPNKASENQLGPGRSLPSAGLAFHFLTGAGISLLHPSLGLNLHETCPILMADGVSSYPCVLGL